MMFDGVSFEDVAVGDRVGICHAIHYGARRDYYIGVVSRKMKTQCIVTVGDNEYRLNKYMEMPGESYVGHYRAVPVAEAKKAIAKQDARRAEARATFAAYLRDMANMVEAGDSVSTNDFSRAVADFTKGAR